MGLAQTVFSTGPDDTEAVLDIYKKSDSSVYSGYQETYNDANLTGALDSIVKGQSELKGILGSKTVSGVLEKLSTSSIINRCLGSSTALKSLARDLGDAAKKVFEVNNKFKDAISFNFNNITSKIPANSLTDARAIIGMVNSATNSGFAGLLRDKGAISGLVTSLTRQATSVGLSGVFKAMSATVTDKAELMCSASDLLPQAVSSGNSNLFLEIANSSIGRQIKNSFPGAVETLVKGLQLPAALQQKDYSSFYKTLNAGMRVVDNNWDKYPKRGSSIGDFALNGVKAAAADTFLKVLKANVFSKNVAPNPDNATAQVGFVGPFDPITADLNTLAAYDDNNNKFLLMMEKFKVKDVGSELKQFLPSIKITPDPIHRAFALDTA